MSMYKFNQIVDSRFDTNLVELLEATKQKIVLALSDLSGVEIVKISEPRHLYFGDSESCEQYRQTYFVAKTGRQTTWNDVFSVVNNIKVARYERY